MTISFSIPGNHKDPSGNAFPYHRTTQGMKRSEEHRKYEAWKEYVRDMFHGAVMPPAILQLIARNKITGAKPITSEMFSQCVLSLEIFFVHTKNGKCDHGDPDNIGKGIADALFANDQHVLTQIKSLRCGSERGEVRVRITL